MARNWAITIGINGYRYLQPLNYAMPDADAVQQFFADELEFHQVYHFTDTSPPIQQDRGPNLNSQPTSTTISRFLRTRFEAPFLRDGDSLWFFFAGHGIRRNNRDYLMPLDGDPEDLERSAIPLNYVSERLRRSGADNIILLIDACRNYAGRRNGLGVGREQQQGVITLFSCSPEESSYEIQEIQQGAFTHVLLNSLRLQGEGNCATVERLYQRLRLYVPQLTYQYKQVTQTPYGVIEPPSKNHLILLPRQASLTDVDTLKRDALTAEVTCDSKTAKRLWTRVLVVSPGDPEAIAGIERLSSSNTSSPSGQLNTPPSTLSSTTTGSTAAAASTSHKQTHLIPPESNKSNLKQSSKVQSPLTHPTSLEQSISPIKQQSQQQLDSGSHRKTSIYAFSDLVSRRNIIQVLFFAGGLGSVMLGMLGNQNSKVPPDDGDPSSLATNSDPKAQKSENTVSTAPVYVEATATGESWVSIIADDTLLFEGVMQPSDIQVWEAQSQLSVYSGDAGALNLAFNGGAPEVMGKAGQPAEKTFP